MILSWFKSNKTIDEVPKVPVEEISVQVDGDIEFTGVGFSVRDVYVHTKLNLKVAYSTSNYMRNIVIDDVRYLDAIKNSYGVYELNWAYGIDNESLDNIAYDIAIKEIRKFINEKDGIIMEELKRNIKLKIIADIESENLEERKKELKQLSKQEINLSFNFTK